MKIWSLPKHENLTTGKKILWKRGEIAPKEGAISSLFPQYFSISLTSKESNYIYFAKCGCSNYFFLNSANLICRGTDISKYFKGSLGIRDNESRLYLKHTGKILYQPGCGIWIGQTSMCSTSAVIFLSNNKFTSLVNRKEGNDQETIQFPNTFRSKAPK